MEAFLHIIDISWDFYRGEVGQGLLIFQCFLELLGTIQGLKKKQVTQ